MPRNEQTKSSTLRSRQRITNKTRLRVVHGSIDAETVTIGEDDGRGALHSTQGVEAEDAAEHHLQQVLNAASNSANNQQRSQRPSTGDAATQTASATLQPPQEAHFIPTPDAQGVVANYDDLYTPNSHEMPYAILMFSDTVEECRTYGLAGRSYTMDEQDAAWLEKWNKQARGEGTSYSTTRRSRNKASEAEEEPQPVITEDWFELCMGMFEKFASEHFPYLHVDSSCPPFSFFQPLFQMPYTPSLFASSLIPDGLPDPSELAQMAKGIYPHWAERKGERRGRSIIPDVNLDEADEGNVYVCFRRREIKPIRKTRRMETTSIDKLTRLSVEFQSALQLANRAIEREEAKKELCDMDQVVWTWRTQLVSITSKFPDLRNPDDDKWLVDKEKVKKIKTPGSLPPITIPKSAANPGKLDDLPDLGPPQVHPRERYRDIQYKIEQDLQRKRDQDVLGWDDVTNMPLQPSLPTHQRYFRSLNGTKMSENVPIERAGRPAAFRHRVGRGGRRYLDRRDSPFTSSPLAIRTNVKTPPRDPFAFGILSNYPASSTQIQPWIGFPHATQPVAENEDTSGSDEVDVELVRKLEERWKFDTDLVSATKPPVRAVIDDFDHRQSMQRYALVKDREWLFAPDLSRAIPDPKLDLTAHLQDALRVQGEHQMHQLQQAALNVPATPITQTTVATMRTPVATATVIRPPSAPQGMSPQTVARSTQSQVAAMILQQHALREKQQQLQLQQLQQPQQPQQPPSQQPQHPQPPQQPQQPQTVQPTHSGQANGAAQPSQPSPSQPNTQTLASPAPTPSQPQQALVNGAASNSVPVSSFVSINMNGANGITPSPPKVTPVNGVYHQSPSASPLPPSMSITGTDPGSNVRVSTPIRKPSIPLQAANNLQVNGFLGLGNPNAMPPNYAAFANTVGGMPAGMYNNLQSIKMINQQNQMMAPYQQFTGQVTPHQVQQQHLHQHQLQQLQLMQLQQQASNVAASHGLQAHFGDGLTNSHAMMGAQPGLHGQSVFPMGLGPTIPNSNMNMNLQNMNLQLGPQNMALRLPPNRVQQQQAGMPRPATAMGGDFLMNVANGSSPMMQGMQIANMGVVQNAQVAAAMSIARAPSTPLSLRNGNGMMPNGNMLMGRPQTATAMQSPMMRPGSAASMHSNLGMSMTQPGAVSLQGSPANMGQPPTPHLRQQPVPGS